MRKNNNWNKKFQTFMSIFMVIIFIIIVSFFYQSESELSMHSMIHRAFIIVSLPSLIIIIIVDRIYKNSNQDIKNR